MNNITTSHKKSSSKILHSSAGSSTEIALPPINDEEWRIGAARANISGFCYYVSPRNAWAWDAKHQMLIDEKLMAVERGEIKRLMIWLPPRHFKSQKCTVHFPAWAMGRDPNRRFIIASYSAELATKFSRQTRFLVDQYCPKIFGIKLKDGSTKVSDWEIERSNSDEDFVFGGYRCAGVGGSLTGTGANCFPSGTMIQTEIGTIDIAELSCMKNPPLVLSYDHVSCKLVYKKIVASRRKTAHEFTEIETSGGCKVRTTADHRIYETQRGYKQANLFNAGDRIIKAKVKGKQDLPDMWENEKRTRFSVPRMLHENTSCRSNTSLLMVQKRIFKNSLRIRKSVQAWNKRFLLFCSMFKCTSCSKEQQTMSSLRRNQKKRKQILFSHVSKESRNTKKASCKIVSRMWKRISTTFKPFTVLFADMCKQSAFKKNDWRRKFTFQRWYKLCKMVRRHASCDFGKRLSSVCSVSLQRNIYRNTMAKSNCEPFKFDYTSHRRKSEKQHCRKLGGFMSRLSHETSQVEEDTVSVVRNICAESEYVYDIQIEETCNFFANGILVHNCLIIDDPHKDRAEANSQTMRDNVWEWYTSTAYTRLESDGAIIVIQTRWHQDDLSGRLIQQMESRDEFAEPWEIVNLPALAESEDDALGRKPGEPLWPEKFPLNRYYSIRASIGSYEWYPLYQQMPQAVSGGGFKAQWFKWYTKNEISFHDDAWWYHDEKLRLFQGVDPAISQKEDADDFVVFTIGITDTSKIIFFDVFHDHVEFNDQPKKVISKYQEWLPEQVGIETNAYQDALRQTIIKKAVIPVKQLNHSGDKFTRIMTTTPFFENGQVYLRMATDSETNVYIDTVRLPSVRIHGMWKKFWQQAVTYGPKSAHDDILDAMENCFSLAKPQIVPNADWK